MGTFSKRLVNVAIYGRLSDLFMRSCIQDTHSFFHTQLTGKPIGKSLELRTLLFCFFFFKGLEKVKLDGVGQSQEMP